MIIKLFLISRILQLQHHLLLEVFLVVVIRVYNNLDSQYPTDNLASSTSKWVVRIDGTSFKIFGAEGSLSGTLTTARDMGEGIFGRYSQTKINDFKVYNTALSDSECEALTT